MKKVLVCSLMLWVYGIMLPLWDTPVFAHAKGIPFFKVNGEYAVIYPVQSSFTPVFNVPPDSDLAPQSVVINQELTFEIDTAKLPIPKEALEKTKLSWNFGDGSPIQEGINVLTLKHSYTKPGSYNLVITADYSLAGVSNQTSNILESMVIHVLPDPTYKLPQAVITVNEQVIADPLKDKPLIPFTQSNQWLGGLFSNKGLSFDATNSKIGSSKIVRYEWDLDDGTTANEPKVSHHYESDPYYVEPKLRVIDENGFYSDTMVTLRNSQKITDESKTASWSILQLFVFAIVGVSVFTLLIGVLLFIKYALIDKNRS